MQKKMANSLLFLLAFLASGGFIYLSYFFEWYAYTRLFEKTNFIILGLEFVVILAVILNLGKIVTTAIIEDNKKRNKANGLFYCLRFLFISISFIMSLFVMSALFYAPNAEKVYQKKLDQIKISYLNKDERIAHLHDKLLNQRESRYKKDIAEIKARYQPQIDRANKGMEKQMGIGGQAFKGKKYLEWQSVAKNYTDKRDAELDRNKAKYDQDISRLETEFTQQQQQLSNQREKVLASESLEQHLGDYESQHSALIPFIKMTEQVTGRPILKIYHALYTIIILITLLVEIGSIAFAKYFFEKIIPA